MAFSSQGNENTSPLPQLPNDLSAKDQLDKEVQEALGGASIEDLMAKSLARGTPTLPTLDPSRPVRGGRPRSGESGRGQSGEHVIPDNIKRGKVTGIREGNVFVDLGGKSQGMCPLEQFTEIPVAPGEGGTAPESAGGGAVELGQEYEFVFKGYDNREGLVLLARRGAVVHGAWETLKPGDIVEGTVTGMNKGGLELRVNNARAFMPAGQVDTKFNPDLSVFLNQRFTCLVTKVDREDRNIVVSRKAILEVEEGKAAEKAWAEISAGQIREGTVRSVQPYGAFVDLGGVDGLLHVSAMSHTRVADPTKIVKVGDKVQVMVLGVDREKNRISLGLKQLTKDPWDTVQGEFPVGTTITGTVRKIMDFGAFVELTPGVEGLVHISQLATRRVLKVSEIVKEGDVIKAKVQNIDLEKRRISLSMADVERDIRATEAANAPAPVEEPAAPASAPSAGGAPAKPTGPKKPQRKVPLKGGLS